MNIRAICSAAALTFASLVAPAQTVQDDATRVHFAWGAEAGSSIDLSAHDMSSFDINAFFGIKYRWINFAGIGVGADIMISNSCRSYPLFALFRTDFSPKPRLLFMDLRGGVVLNYLPGNVSQRAPWFSPGLGINLARSRSFQSYIVAAYTYLGRKDVMEDGGYAHPYPSLNMASIRLGIKF